MAAAGALTSAPPDLRRAAGAHLSRYRGTSRVHTESDLRVFFIWCQDRQLAPLAARRNDLELYLRWLQDVRNFKPSTVSRRLSVVTGFYRTCVIDGVLEHSPAEYVRRPTVPPESPTLGLTHLQFEAMLSAPRQSDNTFDFALVCLLGLLGLRIFETVGADMTTLVKSTATGCCGCVARAARLSSFRCRPRSAAPWTRRWRTAGGPAAAEPAWDVHGPPRGHSATEAPSGRPASGCLGCTRTCCGTRS